MSGTAVTPDGSACSPLRRMALGRVRPSLGARMARQADRDLTRRVCHVYVLRQLNVATPLGGRLRWSEVLRARLRDHWRRSRGHDALSGMSDGVYGLLRPHDHGMPGVILDTGSDSVPLWGSALLCTPRDGGWRRGYRRSGPPVGCRCADTIGHVFCAGQMGGGTVFHVRDQGWSMEGNGPPRSGVGAR